ncbi:unnamed protein product [marine sediment metagenome]|uniref:Uncharacterized protein n=1 Tax=marine sediment metagenome TaxID=412755 RepID=X0XIK0_9ZZZZ
MADKGKVKVFYRESVISCHEDDVEILEETPEGIKIRYTYRKSGKREEFIPRAKIESIIYKDEKAPSTRKPKQAKVAKPEVVEPDPEPVIDPDPVPETPVAAEESTDDTLSESEDFDDEDDLFDDDFE